MKKIAVAAGIVLGLVGLVWWLFFRPPEVTVEVHEVRREAVTESLDEDGLVRSDVQADLSPRIQGRLQSFLLEEGAAVRGGQLIAVLERDELKAAMDAAGAEERAALSALDEARARLAAQERSSHADLLTSRAGVEVAQANLARLESGSRPQEVRTAETAVAAARARREEAGRELLRAQTLHSQGFVPQRELEQARTTVDTAQASLEEALERLSLAREGARREEVQAARGELNRAQAGVTAASAGPAQVEAARRAVVTAAARAEGARAAAEQSRAAFEQAELRAPVAGILELEDVDAGEVVGPNQVVARVVQPDRLWVEVLVDENDRGSVRTGQEVSIVCDAYPGESFRGTLSRVESQAFLKRELRGTPTQDEDRVFRARVDLQEGKGKLWPGMSVFAEIVLGRTEPVVTVPREALLNRDGDWAVYVVESGRAVERVVGVGSRDASRVEITGGLEQGERIVLNPRGVSAGARIREKP